MSSRIIKADSIAIGKTREKVLARRTEESAGKKRRSTGERAMVPTAPREIPTDGKEASYASGFTAGLEEGRRQAGKAVASTVEALKKGLEEMAAHYRAWEDRAGEEILSLSMAIAEKIVRREATTARDVVTATIREALTMLQGQKAIAIKVSAQDYGYLLENEPEFLQTIGGGAILEKDEKIAPGGAIVETATGGADGTIDFQLMRIGDALSLDRIQAGNR
ncbi:MAG: hypothetical protein JW884_07215 [Deltaproteobacteria bacterium]|nr:hypothetical protein [Deltaproteobacteria bacterium]